MVQERGCKGTSLGGFWASSLNSHDDMAWQNSDAMQTMFLDVADCAVLVIRFDILLGVAARLEHGSNVALDSSLKICSQSSTKLAHLAECIGCSEDAFLLRAAEATASLALMAVLGCLRQAHLRGESRRSLPLSKRSCSLWGGQGAVKFIVGGCRPRSDRDSYGSGSSNSRKSSGSSSGRRGRFNLLLFQPLWIAQELDVCMPLCLTPGGLLSRRSERAAANGRGA